MSFPYQGKLIPRAKELRRDMTPQERHLWYDFLKDYPVRFQRQKPLILLSLIFIVHPQS